MATDVKSAPAVLSALDSRGYDTSSLSPIGVRPPLGTYLRELWGRRHFIWMDSRHRQNTKNARTRLGNVWFVLQPLLNGAIYFVMFGLILTRARGDVENFAAYVVIGILMFQSTMRSISSGPGIIRGGSSMIRAFSFPRAALPISAELKDALQMRFTLPVVLVMIMVIPPNEMPGAAWLLVLPIFALQTILNMGITFLMARLGFELPDLSQLMSVISRLLMYGSGVIFPIDQLLDRPGVPALLPFLVEANPIFHMLKLYRAALIDNASAPLASWLIFGGWAIGLLIIGFLAFWHGEAKYGDDR
ncbi:MAG: ABC transporter permease [Brachybacterium sp.]|uniref:ABC transporter permease n=1 Tax=Brachybacterium sp. TaxID=1891286 RepID=UPI00264852DE|nr:ABC transporter permease [Brachybacterium sp.]MDN5686362.1 ABC transporter permease [Brachybacterium sp.]